MLRAALSVALAALVPTLAGCGSLDRLAILDPVGDVQTTNPLALAESGRGEPVEAPAGLSWSLALGGFGTEPREGVATRRYEFDVTVIDSAEPGPTGLPRAAPSLEQAQLVDDSGHRFRCHRGRVPDTEGRALPEPGEPNLATYSLIFDLPSNYRFRQILHVTVHWQLRLQDGTSLPISSRFRTR